MTNDSKLQMEVETLGQEIMISINSKVYILGQKQIERIIKNWFRLSNNRKRFDLLFGRRLEKK